MRKLLPIAFFLIQMIPALQPWVPQIVPSCAACEATGHELCASSKHDCGAADAVTAPIPAVEEETKTAHCCTFEPERVSEIGHKCPAAQYQLLADASSRYVYQPVEPGVHSITSTTWQSFPPDFITLIADCGIDHPPSILL